MRHLLKSTVAMMAVLAIAGASHAATITILNNDTAGEGFNDPTPVAPVGGNPGTTLGAQRLNAFTYAANIWAARLSSPVTIVVRAQMNPQTCTATSAVLGSAGATTVHGDFPNAPVASTLYCQALANSLAGVDLDGANPDINATFNSNINGSAGCLGGTSWYYGYDQNPPGGDIDFISVVIHEIGHGLGFQTFVNLGTGAKLGGFNDTYMLNLNRNGAMPPDYPSMTNAQRISASTSDPNLRWVGANVTAFHPTIPLTAGLSGPYARVHAPNPAVSGSSVSHFSSALVPNQIMEPSYAGPNHNIELTLQLMEDIGWVTIPSCVPALTTVNDTDTLTVNQTLTTWNLKIEVTNTGANTAFDVTASLLGAPAWLSIPDWTGTYGTITSGNSAFNSDTYTLDITDWPGGSFSLDMQIFYEDNCGTPHNQVVTVHLLPATLPTPVPGQSFTNRLEANVPNPFNPATTISYELAQSGPASLRVYDVGGKLVRTLVNRSHAVGRYEARWDGRDDSGVAVASGVYFYRISSGNYTQTRRMVLLK